jgi:nudix-type nucleoside diphosphatase (YffH/AdpP family)
LKAKILEKEILSNRWAEYACYTIEYTRSDGKVEKQKREIHDSGNGAAVLLYNQNKRSVLLIKQFRLATLVNGNESGVITEVCAGLVEENNPEKTIKKEIEEEIGIKIDKVNYLFSGYATPGAKTEKIFFYTAEYEDDLLIMEGSHGLKSEQEDIIVFEANFDTIYDQIYSGEVEDCKTIILLQYAKIHIFI